MIASDGKPAPAVRVMVPSVTPPRRPTELLARVLSVLACLVFVLGLRDAGLRQLFFAKAADPIPISGLKRTATLDATVVAEGGRGIARATVQVFWESDGRFY